jgi:hypothetical protein
MMDYKDLEYQQDHVNDKIKRLNQEISDKKHALSNFQVKEKTKKLEKLLNEFTGINVEIK